MRTIATRICLLAAFSLVTPAQDPVAVEERFPAWSALAEELSPKALAELSQLVQTLVDDEEIVGAELLGIRNGHPILHEAYGWSDREADVPMEIGRAFREDGRAQIETMGRTGQRLVFRDISPMQVPFRVDLELANPLVGIIVSTIGGVELPEGTFALSD